MSKFILAPAAKSDLIEIWNYYAAEIGNPDLADKIRDELFDGIRAVAGKPDIGHLRRDLASEPLRFWRIRKYLIIYRSKVSPVQIVRVLHGARDVQAVLSES
jgi:toxin ParE1/3/4